MPVDFGTLFLEQFKHFPQPDQNAITAFISEVKQSGLGNLPGRNKPSWDVDKDDPSFSVKVKYARENNLHHYHCGIPVFSGNIGDQTSRYIIHYQLLSDDLGWVLKVVDYGGHPPFDLPKLQYLA